MKIICKSAAQVPGYGIVTKGRSIEWPDGAPIPPQVAGNFIDASSGRCLAALYANAAAPSETHADEHSDAETHADEHADAGAPAETHADEHADAGAPSETHADEHADAKALVAATAKIGRAKLAARLDALHVSYSDRMSATELAKILLRHNGEKID